MAENADLERDLYEDEGINSVADHPDAILLDLDYNGRFDRRLMAMNGLTDDLLRGVARTAGERLGVIEANEHGSGYEGYEAIAGADTAAAWARSTARMTTLYDYRNQTDQDIFETNGYAATDDRFRAALSQYHFMHSGVVRYGVAQMLWQEQTSPQRQREISAQDRYDEIWDIMTSDDPAIKNEVSALVRQYEAASLRGTVQRAIRPDSGPGEASEEATYQLFYALTASDIAPETGAASYPRAEALFEPLRVEFARELEELKVIASTLDNSEIRDITENGFGNDVEDAFTIGENDQGLDPQMQISERWALAAAAIADANDALNVLFPEEGIGDAQILPFPHTPLSPEEHAAEEPAAPATPSTRAANDGSLLR